MILLIDNYDSFSYNLYQLVGSIQPDVRVMRNDALSVSDIAKIAPQAVILSPGPGRPHEAGICEAVVRELSGEIPILGVCLGHQAICEAFGGEISYAKTLMHGKTSTVTLDRTCPLFYNMDGAIQAARYHSLAAVRLPSCLRMAAQTADGEIMAVAHAQLPVYGLQFHPESVLTPQGGAIIRNFLEVCTS